MDDERRDRTLWCGGLDARVTEDLLRELFVQVCSGALRGFTSAHCASLRDCQAGPVEEVRMPKDNNTGRPKNFAFVTFAHAATVGYTLALMEGVSLYGRRIKLERRPQATVDDTYVNMMKRHYDYMETMRAPRNTFQQSRESWCPSFSPPSQGPPTVFQIPVELPLPFVAPPVPVFDRAAFGREHNRDAVHAVFPASNYDRYDGHFREPDYYREDAREFRSKMGQSGMHKYRDPNGYDRRPTGYDRRPTGYDRRYQEPRHRRYEDGRGDSHTKKRRC